MKLTTDLLDTLDALGSGHQLEPELGVHHLGQTSGHHVPIKILSLKTNPKEKLNHLNRTYYVAVVVVIVNCRIVVEDTYNL